jgi:hypothetical protein
VTLANSSGLTGERIGFLVSEVYLPRFGVLDPRIIKDESAEFAFIVSHEIGWFGVGALFARSFCKNCGQS